MSSRQRSFQLLTARLLERIQGVVAVGCQTVPVATRNVSMGRIRVVMRASERQGCVVRLLPRLRRRSSHVDLRVSTSTSAMSHHCRSHLPSLPRWKKRARAKWMLKEGCVVLASGRAAESSSAISVRPSSRRIYPSRMIRATNMKSTDPVGWPEFSAAMQAPKLCPQQISSSI